MSVRPILGGAQPPDQVSVSVGALLIVFILILIALAAYRDPKLAAMFGAVGAMGALLVALLR